MLMTILMITLILISFFNTYITEEQVYKRLLNRNKDQPRSQGPLLPVPTERETMGTRLNRASLEKTMILLWLYFPRATR